jgi:tol-pal system protein YbgF
LSALVLDRTGLFVVSFSASFAALFAISFATLIAIMKIPFRTAPLRLAPFALCALFALPGLAHAGLLEDDEARKAILDLRAKVDQIQQDLHGQIASKADKASALELVNQIEQLRQEVAKLRGQIEVLTNELSNTQQRQKDFYVDLDNRLRKLEPKKVTVDGKEAQVDPGEQKSYDAALAVFKNGDYRNAASGFADFLRRYPESAYAAAAQYGLGTAYYALRDCKSAIDAHRALVKTFPDNPKAPDAMLNVAICHIELKEKPQAKKVLEALILQYPDSSAAQTARERLSAK